MLSIRYFGIWLCRFRKRCGYGVHSPFAFNFITGVVFERGMYYAYTSLDKQYRRGLFWHFSHLRKCYHFLFRFANFVHPQVLLCDPTISKADRAYLNAGCCKADHQKLANLTSLTKSRVLVCCSTQADTLPALLANIRQHHHSDSALLLKVTTSAERKRCVSVLNSSKHSVVTFDLYHYLIVFFNPELHKQHYVVNFFD